MGTTTGGEEQHRGSHKPDDPKRSAVGGCSSCLASSTGRSKGALIQKLHAPKWGYNPNGMPPNGGTPKMGIPPRGRVGRVSKNDQKQKAQNGCFYSGKF